MKPYQTTLAGLIAENPSIATDMGEDPLYGLRERTPAAAARVLRGYPRDGAEAYGISYPHAYWEGVVARWQGDAAKARTAFVAARAEVEKIVEKQPDFAAALSLLGMIDAGLGRKEEAIREGRRACELLPMSRDAVDGPLTWRKSTLGLVKRTSLSSSWLLRFTFPTTYTTESSVCILCGTFCGETDVSRKSSLRRHRNDSQ
jgi:tetratricopeptide (TPR) repeat protein